MSGRALETMFSNFKGSFEDIGNKIKQKLYYSPRPHERIRGIGNIQLGEQVNQAMHDAVSRANQHVAKSLVLNGGQLLSPKANYQTNKGAVKTVGFTIPSEVKVAGVIYNVVEKDLVVVGESAVLGSCDFDKTEIELKTGMSQTRKEQVFIHELTHAILFEAGFTEHDEDLVDRFAIVAHQVLKDNWNQGDLYG
ncbi:hypothetical protein [Listeria newyorkensis]|uniref:hypothetical protein n=1 Tax=Listeria newyorkensis TaxID=1497681 RepID=UPI001FD58335|nr:hypothetical protein [Listeria newyorkensis]